MSILEQIIKTLCGFNIWSTSFRILLAAVMGSIIGMDRSRHGRAAGTRTHILVCLGAAITTLLGFYTATYLGFSNDPLRLGARVVSGIGFLGVGTIMIRNNSHVTGLTTAAGLWATACIGLAVGAGFYSVAILSFLTVLITVTIVTRIERRLGIKDTGMYYIEMADMQLAKRFYLQIADQISRMDIVPAKSGLPGHVGIELVIKDPKNRTEVFAALQQSEDVLIALPNHT